jgi:UDP-2,4-diacetamido-2,4,6-trideoxy-beta-L-altropyranose hydrolase
MQTNQNQSDRFSPGFKISLRPVEINDREWIWQCANDPISRSASFSSETILWNDHIKWFDQKLKDRDCVFWVIVQNLNLHPVGTVRYETSGHSAIISINITPDNRRRGVGSQAIQISSELLFETTLVTTVHAYIKIENTASINVFTRSGYSNTGLVDINGNAAYDYAKTRLGENPA